jgi:hypothetical protein
MAAACRCDGRVDISQRLLVADAHAIRPQPAAVVWVRADNDAGRSNGDAWHSDNDAWHSDNYAGRGGDIATVRDADSI